MYSDIIEQQDFRSITVSRLDFTRAPLVGKRFYDVDFIGCNFSNTFLDGTIFENCRFRDSLLSLTSVINTQLIDVTFSECKLNGINFAVTNSFMIDISLDNCVVENSTFAELSLVEGVFTNSRIAECDFIRTNLTGADFGGSDLSGTAFHNCNLSKANFCSATGYRINPTNNIVKRARFSYPEVVSLLDHLDLVIG